MAEQCYGGALDDPQAPGQTHENSRELCCEDRGHGSDHRPHAIEGGHGHPVGDCGFPQGLGRRRP